MNPDTFPENDCLEKLINTAKSDEDVGIVTPVTILKNNTKEFSSYGNFNNKLTKKNSENILQVDWVHGNILLVKKKFFEQAGCFDENIFIEFDERDLQILAIEAIGLLSLLNFELYVNYSEIFKALLDECL